MFYFFEFVILMIFDSLYTNQMLPRSSYIKFHEKAGDFAI